MQIKPYIKLPDHGGGETYVMINYIITFTENKFQGGTKLYLRDDTTFDTPYSVYEVAELIAKCYESVHETYPNTGPR
jgi:hypothetical protein